MPRSKIPLAAGPGTHRVSTASYASPAQRARKGAKRWRLVAGIVIAVSVPAGAAQASADQQAGSQVRSGQGDFDWEVGTWKTSVRVLQNPLSGASPKWAEYVGTSVVRLLLAGRANFVELSVEGPDGRIEGGSLRLYSPQSRQWSLNYANLRSGLLTSPVYGAFDGNGRGIFYGQDMIEGRAILVRFVITVSSSSEARFEQAYSDDAGATWEVNWISTDNRL